MPNKYATFSSDENSPIKGEVIRRAYHWFVKFKHKGITRALPVSKVDAWNYDIVAGNLVHIKIERGRVRLHGKKSRKYKMIDEA